MRELLPSSMLGKALYSVLDLVNTVANHRSMTVGVLIELVRQSLITQNRKGGNVTSVSLQWLVVSAVHAGRVLTFPIEPGVTPDELPRGLAKKVSVKPGPLPT